MKIKKIISIAMVSLLTVACLSGCGSSSKVATQYIETGMMADGVDMNFTSGASSSFNSYKATTSDTAMEYKTESVTTNSGSGSSSGNGVNSNIEDTIPKANKIIYTGELRVHTSDMNKTESIVSEKIIEYGGYVSGYTKEENSHINIIARIPSENFNSMLDDEDIAKDNSVYKRMDAEDVTLQYSDTEAELESLRVQEERLLTYLKSANNVEEMLDIETHLQSVRQRITTVTNRLKYLDNYISYSELNISIYNRYDAPVEEASFFERLKHTIVDSFEDFVDFCEDTVLFVVSIIPTLIVLVIIVFAFIKWRKSRKKKKEKKKEINNN